MKSPVLVGPRGSGKTTVGKTVASMLSYPFVDADEEFVRCYGAITNFVHAYGWEAFRKQETELIADICRAYQSNRIVLAPGGGAVAHDNEIQYRNRNVEQLRKFGAVFYLLPYPDLKQSTLVLAARVQNDEASVSSRPPLTACSDASNEMLKILEQRNGLYIIAAHHTLYTGEKLPAEVAREVIAVYERIIVK